MDNSQELLDKKKQREQDRVVAEALDKIKVYVENGRQEAFIQIKPPQLTKFQLPEVADKQDLPEVKDLMECDGVEATAIERWNQNEVLELDLVKEEYKEHFGKIQIDEVTGERYMLLPLDVDILINPDTLTTPIAVKDRLDELDEHTDGHTFHLQPPEEQQRQEPGSQYCRHEFKIPKLNLNFKLVVVSVPPGVKESQLNLDLD